MVSEASFKARAAFCSPSAAITWSKKSGDEERGGSVKITINKPWLEPHGLPQLLQPWLSAVVWGADSLC